MFTRKTITVPAAGKKTRFDVGGFAVVVAAMNLYFDIDDVPKLIFDSESNSKQPLFPQSVYTGNQGSIISTFFIEGTEASSGDEIELLLSDDCMQQEINPVLLSVSKPDLVQTFTKSVSSTIVSISESEVTKNGKLAKSINIQAIGGKLKYSFLSNPSSIFFILKDEEQVKINGSAFILGLKMIRESVDVVVTIQPEF